MRGVSDQFLETLRGSHLAVFRARVCTTFQTGTSPTGTEIEVTGGDVTSSATNMIRSTLELTTPGVDEDDLPMWPRLAGDLLAPYGNEIYVERGIQFGNGQREFVGLGYFRIETPEQDEVPDGEITISGSDRMAGIVDARFLAPRQFASTLTRKVLVETLVKEVYPSAVITWDDTAVRDGTVGRTVITEDDRAGTLKDFITSLGKVGYFDHTGTFQIKTPPSTTGAPSWTIDSGADGVLVEMARGLTRERVYNAVVAVGEAGDTTAPARGVALNLDTTSPTYYYGPFGPVPMFYSSPFLTNNTQAGTAAASILRQQLGLPYQVELSSIANPALEPFDVLAVKYPKTARSRTLRTEAHVIDEVTIPLVQTEPVTLKTREQQTELIGDGS